MSKQNRTSESATIDAIAKDLARQLRNRQQTAANEAVFPFSSSKAAGAECPVEASADERKGIAFPPSGPKAGGAENPTDRTLFPPSSEKAGVSGGEDQHEDITGPARDPVSETPHTFPPSTDKSGSPGGEINSGDDADQECKLP